MRQNDTFERRVGRRRTPCGVERAAAPHAMHRRASKRPEFEDKESDKPGNQQKDARDEQRQSAGRRARQAARAGRARVRVCTSVAAQWRRWTGLALDAEESEFS